jgi:hypothetical protein
MIRRFLRVSLAALALVTAICGSINLNRVVAQPALIEGGGGGDFCSRNCPECTSGTLMCCSQGDSTGTITCYMPKDY